jgi:predicted dienelactone hydrolase
MWALLLCVVGVGSAQAGTGLQEVPGMAGDGPVTVFHPTAQADQALPVAGGHLVLPLAPGAAVAAGNGRLVVFSHGSGGSPWVHTDLARRLVAQGYTVAVPQHQGDHYRDDHSPGPESWARRPAEVSRAIDAVAATPALARHLQLDRVGVYGMSAGGHTALSLAGGRWSPRLFARHCQNHLADDFNACVGLFMALNGGWADGLKLWLADTVLRLRFRDDTPHQHHDPRVAAVVAAVPAAADFDPASFHTLQAPLGLVTAAQDRWLHPRFHSSRVLAACPACEHVAHLPDGGHGALLSPLPPGLTGLVGDLLNDPPGFQRQQALPAVDAAIQAFFDRHLRAPASVAAR